MSSRRGIAIVAFTLLAGCKKTPASILGFEGEITMQSELAGAPPSTTTVHVKGDKALAELPTNTGARIALITDATAKKNTWLFYDKHEVIEESLVAHPPSGFAMTVVETQRDEVVAGTHCSVVEVHYTKGPGPYNEVCVAKTLSALSLAITPITDQLLGSMEDLPVSGFPLRIVTRGPSGAVTARIEVTKIDKAAQADSLFEIPAGFTPLAKPRVPSPGPT